MHDAVYHTFVSWEDMQTPLTLEQEATYTVHATEVEFDGEFPVFIHYIIKH